MGAEAEGEEQKPGKSGAPAKGASASVGGAGQPLIDLDFVRGLIDAVDSSGIDALEITRAGTRVKISKTPPAAAPGPAMYAQPGLMQAAPQAPAPGPEGAGTTGGAGAAAEGGAGAAGGAAAAAASGLVDVKSPMVGSFYRAPAPEAPPYVEVGTRVSKGQTLCILEAMKLMNELESEVEGVVREVLVDNADPVEYGQVLFRIDPNG